MYVHISIILFLFYKPSQQQKQRAAQNSESVMKAYGIPKPIVVQNNGSNSTSNQYQQLNQQGHFGGCLPDPYTLE
jgi:hypothetical protein